MKIDIVTLFPELFGPFLTTSFVGRAVSTGRLSVDFCSPRQFGLGVHRSVDDSPYGGGAGMVLRVDCVVKAIEACERADGVRAHRVLLTPQGARFDQRKANHLATLPAVTLICGRYEGFDDRVRAHVDEEISLGDFVLSGGEVAAMAVIEATARLIPGVVGNAASLGEESHSEKTGGVLEYPQYTRPPEFRGLTVPPVLLSGDHQKIAAWRQHTALERTKSRRPDLLARDSPEDGSSSSTRSGAGEGSE